MMNKKNMEARVVSAFDAADIWRALSLAYPERMAALTAWLAVDGKDWLPTELWLAILSRCWRQTRTIMCVCRAWHALVHRPAYWRLAFTERLPSFPAGFPDFARAYFLTNFHTLDGDLFDSFKDQVGWLFHKYTDMSIYKTQNDTLGGDSFRLRFCFYRYTVTYRIFDHFAIFAEKDMISTSGFVQKVLYTTGTKYCAMARQSDKTCIYEYIEWVDKTIDLKWQGTGRAASITDTYAWPEGDGTWSRLSTGEILLQGKEVAYRGYMDDGGVAYYRGKRIKTLEV